MNATQKFTAVVRGSNFMTPTILDIEDLGNGYVVELSTGEGFTREPIYGVTVVDYPHREHLTYLSRCFTNKKDALFYIEQLRED